MELLGQILFTMLLLELFEIHLQKATNLGESIEKLYGYYNRSVFLFFLVHPTLYFVLGVLLYFDAFNFFGLTILAIKTFDIFFKIEMIRQRYLLQEMDGELKEMMRLEMTNGMRYFSVLFHLPLLYMAIF